MLKTQQYTNQADGELLAKVGQALQSAGFEPVKMSTVDVRCIGGIWAEMADRIAGWELKKAADGVRVYYAAPHLNTGDQVCELSRYIHPLQLAGYTMPLHIVISSRDNEPPYLLLSTVTVNQALISLRQVGLMALGSSQMGIDEFSEWLEGLAQPLRLDDLLDLLIELGHRGIEIQSKQATAPGIVHITGETH